MPSWWWWPGTGRRRTSRSRTNKQPHEPAPAACSPRHSHDTDFHHPTAFFASASATPSSVARCEGETIMPRRRSLDWPSPAPRQGTFGFGARRGGGSEVAAVVVAGHAGFLLPRPKSEPPLPSQTAECCACASSPCTSVSGGCSSESDEDHSNNRYADDPVVHTGARTIVAPDDAHDHIMDDNKPLVSRSGENHRFLDLSIQQVQLQSLFVGASSSGGAPPRGRTFLLDEKQRGARTRSLSPRPRGHGGVASSVAASPGGDLLIGLGPWSAVKRTDNDDIKSRSQPLPLPPVPIVRFPVPSSSTIASEQSQSQWKKGKLLGSGTFGQVYLGFNSESGKLCAIKEVQVISDDSKSKEQLRQLNQEIDMLRQFSHQNVVQYYGSELTNETLSIYLEYVSGGSIHNLLRDYGPFTEPVICYYTRQILRGLAYLHSRKTVHRDIKGANILVCPSGEVKLADFGVAKHITSFAEISSFRGSPYWMAPEVIRNNKRGYSLEVDIWSLGCTIIEMGTGRHPWHQYADVPAMFKIAYSKELPEIPESFSEKGKEFLSLCLQRDPAQRPSATQLLGHPFLQDNNHGARVTKCNVTQLRNFPAEACQNKSSRGSSSRRSIAPLLDIKGQSARDFTRFSTARPSSDRACSSSRRIDDARTNMSLPVSPCSSPLRQLKQSNWSCLPSPSHHHPVFPSSSRSAAYNPVSHMQNQRYDPWHDIHHV